MSLYSIQKDLIDLFNHIEENDGEITDAQIEYLEIKQEELADKLEKYRKAVLEWKADAAACKDEEKRIATRRKIYENRVERLKKSMLTAVKMFGEDTKSGGKCIELTTSKLSTRKTKSTAVYEERAKLFANYFREFLDEVYSQGILETGDEVDLHGVLDIINANLKAEHGDIYSPFTIGDLFVKYNVTTKVSLADIMKHDVIANLLNTYPFETNIELGASKEELKSDILGYDADNRTSMAEIVENESLMIK